MARASWIDEDNHPLIDDQMSKLEHFTKSLADGVVDNDELGKQEDALLSAMKAVESELSDEQHAKVTKLLVELSAYNVMNVLHSLAAERARSAFGA